jgi:isopenicillin N synthase-like dioxygenase
MSNWRSEPMYDDEQQQAQFRQRFQLDEARFGAVRTPVQTLPVIDIGPLWDDEPSAGKARAASQIHQACVNSGFFYVRNFGISKELMAEAVDWSRKFYTLPQAAKDKVRCHDITTYRGYGDWEKITPGFEPDHKEYYSMGLELDDVSLPMSDRGLVLWPDDDLPGFKTFFRHYIGCMNALSQKLVQGFALSLGLAPDFFDSAFRQPYLFMRPSYYPPARDVLAAKKWSCGPHTDYMAFTILQQDDVGGLEVMSLDGSWIEAPPIPGSMIINIGDMMASWTNDLYASTPHRVANRSPDRSRISLATFFGPDSSTVVSCLDTCQSKDNPPRYPPITTAEHVMNIFADTMPEEATKSIVRANDHTTQVFRSGERIGG